MSDTKENDPNEVLKMQTADPAVLQNEIAQLRAALAQKDAQIARHPSNRQLPQYFLNEAAFLEDNHYPRGCTLEWDGEPNQEMVPVNAPAEARMRAFLQHVTEGAMEVAAQRGRHFYGLVSDRNVLLDTYRQDVTKEMAQPTAPVIQMPVRRDEVPAMPTTDAAIAAARRQPRTNSKVGKVEVPTSGKPDRGAPMLPAIVGRAAG
jgi:hypothetical protein